MRCKTRTLTVFLLKEHIKTVDEAVKEDANAQRYQINPDLPYTGALYVGDTKNHPPSWLSFVNTGLIDQLDVSPNVSTSAVLLIEMASRIFAITFGYGRYLLEPESCEIDFGLKVALNAVDADRLRSVDVRTFEELALHTRRQTSRSSSLDTFGLDISRDLLRLVTGEPRDSSFAKRVTGADSLTFTAPVEFKDLGDKCNQMLNTYGSDHYKDRFGWVDHLKRVRDKSLEQQLIELLLEAFKTGNIERLYLAPPEIQDWQKVGGFSYSARLSVEDKFPDLDLQDYTDSLSTINELDYTKLLKDRVLCFHTESDQVLNEWSIFDCIVFETEFDNKTYALVSGEWYEISRGFADNVNAYIGDISMPDVALPDAEKNEWEGNYNARVAALLPDTVLMDCKCPVPSGAQSGIEVCDLFTGKCQFIHIKRSNRSSTLSHLFSQGTNSAFAFLSDAEYRRLAREHIEKLNPNLSTLIPDSRPEPHKYEVVYAIISKNNSSELASLPFFSKLNLMQATQQLTTLGYKVSATKVKCN